MGLKLGESDGIDPSQVGGLNGQLNSVVFTSAELAAISMYSEEVLVEEVL